MRRVLGLVLGLIAGPVGAQDHRLVAHFYQAEEVVRIAGKVGVQATIAFGEDEHIENVAIGDSARWQVTPNKRANMLFIKPQSPRARTNMTVVTDRRSYFFDLVAAPYQRPLYALRFTYPAAPKAEVPPATPAGAETQLSAKVAADPAGLNFGWAKSGKASLLPSRVFDDGVATFVSWPERTSVPAILVSDGAGGEGPVNYAVRGDVVVIDGVPETIILRMGRDTATLKRRAGVPVASLGAGAKAP